MGWWSARSKSRNDAPAPAAPACATTADSEPRSAEPLDAVACTVRTMLSQDRAAVLLHGEVAESLSAEQRKLAWAALETSLALVPAGDVRIDESLGRSHKPDAPRDEPHDRIVHVEATYVDRWAVSNARFASFVSSGGYADAALWDASVRPLVATFVDRTGRPGPRFWRDGTYPADDAELPVVGICWFEADAFARWTGKRLLTGAEWQHAAAGPSAASGVAGQPVARRFPWGDTMDRRKAHLGGQGHDRLLPVNALPDGTSPSGLWQMVGNVWEWTADDFVLPEWPMRERPRPLKALRGGSLRTYFDHEATLSFASADDPLARRHNVGFRCGVSAGRLIGASVTLPPVTLPPVTLPPVTLPSVPADASPPQPEPQPEMQP